MGEWLGQFWHGLTGNFRDLADGGHAGQMVGRAVVAAVLGGVLGYEREQHGKSAGLRTHMLVALAAAFFVIIPDLAGMTAADLSRVIQGLAAGIGFLGAGMIIKHSDQSHVVGLTTAAGLYFTATVGVAAGMGRAMTAILGTVLALVVLAIVPRFERRPNG
jgi:putative Mg2+ transporter-C (MgtC) family protein